MQVRRNTNIQQQIAVARRPTLVARVPSVGICALGTDVYVQTGVNRAIGLGRSRRAPFGGSEAGWVHLSASPSGRRGEAERDGLGVKSRRSPTISPRGVAINAERLPVRLSGHFRFLFETRCDGSVGMSLGETATLGFMTFELRHCLAVAFSGRSKFVAECGQRGTGAFPIGYACRADRDIQLVKLGLLAASRAFRHIALSVHASASTCEMTIDLVMLQEQEV